MLVSVSDGSALFILLEWVTHAISETFNIPKCLSKHNNIDDDRDHAACH